MNRATRFYALALGSALTVLPGCFSYIPAKLDAVTPGEPVKVELSRVAMAELMLSDDSVASRLGPQVRGTLEGRNDAEILLRVPLVAAQEGPIGQPLGQNVRIPTGGVMEIGTRRINWLQTGLAIAGASGVAAFMLREIMGGAVARVIPSADEPNNLRVQLGSVRIR